MKASNDRRVLYTGSSKWMRPYVVRYTLVEQLDMTNGILTLVHGACPNGVDNEVELWGRSQSSERVKVESHKADWRKHPRAAGMIRNKEMVDLGADLCIALVQDESPGSTNCYEHAIKQRIPVVLWETSSAKLLAADVFFEADRWNVSGKKDILSIARRMTEDHAHRDETISTVSEWCRELPDLSTYDIYQELETSAFIRSELLPPESGVFDDILEELAD